MITIQLNKETPEEVFSLTARYVLQVRDVIYSGGQDQPELPLPVTEAKRPEPTPVAVKEPEQPSAENESSQERPDGGDGLDAEGMPWDDRIHASTKTKTVNGCWKKRRGVEDVLVRQVEAELKGGQSQTQEVDEQPDIQPATQWPGASVVSEGAAGVSVPPAPVEDAPKTEISGKSFSQLTALITEKVTENPEIGASIQEAVLSHGYGSVPELSTCEPEAIAEVYATIEAL